MANSNNLLVTGKEKPAVSNKSRARTSFFTAGKVALSVIAAAAAVSATELLVSKGEPFTTRGNTRVSPDSLLARDGAGHYGALLTVTPNGGSATKTPIREGDSVAIDGTNVKLMAATVGARTVWFTFDTTAVTGPDSTFALSIGQSKDTLGASITSVDFSRVPSNGEYGAILRINTARGTSIVELKPGETARVLTSSGKAVDIKAVSTASTYSESTVELQVTEVSTSKLVVKDHPLDIYGCRISVNGIGVRVDETGRTDYVSVSVKVPNGATIAKELVMNVPVSVVDTVSGSAISLTATSAAQMGDSVAANIIVEQVQNTSVFALGQSVAVDTIVGTVKLTDAHDSVAVFDVNGESVTATVGDEVTLPTYKAGKKVTFTVTSLALGKDSAFATVVIKVNDQLSTFNSSKGLFTAHQDRIVSLSKNRYGLVFAEPGNHTASIYDISGRLVASLPFSGMRGVVDLSILPSGRYVMSIDGMKALGHSIQH